MSGGPATQAIRRSPPTAVVPSSRHGHSMYEGHTESKERLRIQFAHLFCCRRSLVSGVQCHIENCLKQLYVGPCHVVSAEIAVSMTVPLENPTDCEMRGVIRFQQTDDALGYFAEYASTRVEFFFFDNTRPHTAQQTRFFLRE